MLTAIQLIATEVEQKVANNERVKEVARERSYQGDYSETEEESEEEGSNYDLDLRGKAEKAKEKSGQVKERAVSIRDRTRGSIGKRSRGRRLGGGFLRTAEKLDTARRAFKRNFGDFKGIGLDTTGEFFSSSSTPDTGEEFEFEIVEGDKDSSEKSESGFDMDLGFDMEV
ncbi:MAG: hypothetical protein ABEJ93_04570 [Candidatus Nanohalobium sp.]